MKRFVTVAVLALASGCSNAPIAGFLDVCFPGRGSGQLPPERPRDTVPPGDRIAPPDLGAPVGPGRP